jgi:hypothetical protein
MSNPHASLIVYRCLHTPTVASVNQLEAFLGLLNSADVVYITEKLIHEGRLLPARFITWKFQQHQVHQQRTTLTQCLAVPTDILHMILAYLEAPHTQPAQYVPLPPSVPQPLPPLPTVWNDSNHYVHYVQEHYGALARQSVTLLEICTNMEVVQVQEFLQRYILHHFTHRQQSAHVGHAACRAAELGETGIVCRLLQEVKQVQRSYTLNRVLYSAIRTRQWNTVDVLLASFSAPSWYLQPYVLRQLGFTASPHRVLTVCKLCTPADRAEVLWATATAGRSDLVNTLLEDTEPARTTTHVQGMETALHGACRYGQHACVVSLLQYIPVNSYVTYTPLAVAAYHGHYQVCQTLLAEGADPALGSDYRDLPLVRAVYNGHAHIVRLLLRHSSNPNVTDVMGHTLLDNCLHTAVTRTYLDFTILQLLHEFGGTVSTMTMDIHAFIGNNRIKK